MVRSRHSLHPLFQINPQPLGDAVDIIEKRDHLRSVADGFIG